jgi:hypothetical protein
MTDCDRNLTTSQLVKAPRVELYAQAVSTDPEVISLFPPPTAAAITNESQAASKVIAFFLNFTGPIVAVIFIQSIVVFGGTGRSYRLCSDTVHR